MIGHILGEIKSADINVRSVLGGISVVIRFRRDFAGEHVMPHDVNAVIMAGDILLELGRTPYQVREAMCMLWSQV
jgi:hypothetical protein